MTGGSVELAYVDQGDTGEDLAAAAAGHGIAPEVVKLAEAKRGLVLLPRRWVVERSFGWGARSLRPGDGPRHRAGRGNIGTGRSRMPPLLMCHD